MAQAVATPPLRRATSWRISQICVYLASLAFAIGTLIGYKGLHTAFDHNMSICMLNSTITVSDKENSQNCTLSLERSSDYSCKFVYFDVICSIIYSIIGCWFFIACTTEAKTRPDETVIQSWKLVVPSVLFTGVFLLLSLICSSLISSGLASFFDSFITQSNRLNCLRFKLSNQPAVNATIFVSQVRTFGAVAESFSWLCTVAWSIALAILVCRCCVAADFVTNSEQLATDGSGSRTGSLATRSSKGSHIGWRRTLRRLNGTLKGSLRSCSDNSLHRILRNPWRRMHASSPNMQQQESAALSRRGSTTPSTTLPLVMYNHQTKSVTASDADFESAMGDSHYGSVHETSLVPSQFTLGDSQDLTQTNAPKND